MAAILKALRDEGCSVAFVPADLLRPPAFSEPIEELGVTILDDPTAFARYLRDVGATIDLYLLSRPQQAVA